MGAGAISGLAQEEILELSRRTNFSQKQIRLLWKRFTALDHADRGFISALEFKYLPELICNPLADRLLEVMRKKERASEGIANGRRKSQALPGDVDFPLFVMTMDVFHPDKVTLISLRTQINTTLSRRARARCTRPNPCARA